MEVDLGSGLILGIELTGDWEKAQKIMQDLPKVLPPGMKGMLKGEAETILSKLKTRALNQLKKPATGTLLKRQSNENFGKKPLLDTGTLMRLVQVHALGDGFLVGIDAGKVHGPSGLNAIHLLKRQEKGYVQIIEMTQAMRAKLATIFGSLRSRGGAGRGTGFIVIRVPPRPLFSELEKEIEKDRDKIAKRALTHMHRYLLSHGIETTIVDS